VVPQLHFVLGYQTIRNRLHKSWWSPQFRLAPSERKDSLLTWWQVYQWPLWWFLQPERAFPFPQMKVSSIVIIVTVGVDGTEKRLGQHAKVTTVKFSIVC
jgi:hypothetical protein